MQEILNFMNTFISFELSALEAKYIERDNRIYEHKKKEVERFLDPTVESGLGRALIPDDDWFEEGEKMVRSGTLIPRRIFQIKKYNNPLHGTLYRAYTGSTMRPSTGRFKYAVNFYVTPKSEGLMIISRYDLDVLPQPGARLEDGRISWIHHSGATFETLGRLVDVRKFEAPDSSVQRNEYEAE